MYSRCYVIGEYTTTISEQRLGKQVLTETNTHITIDLLWKQDVIYVARDSEKEPVTDCEHSNIKAWHFLTSWATTGFLRSTLFHGLNSVFANSKKIK
jgi:hypothetical protein